MWIHDIVYPLHMCSISDREVVKFFIHITRPGKHTKNLWGNHHV